jgi:hypothetical protein
LPARKLTTLAWPWPRRTSPKLSHATRVVAYPTIATSLMLGAAAALHAASDGRRGAV